MGRGFGRPYAPLRPKLSRPSDTFSRSWRRKQKSVRPERKPMWPESKGAPADNPSSSLRYAQDERLRAWWAPIRPRSPPAYPPRYTAPLRVMNRSE